MTMNINEFFCLQINLLSLIAVQRPSMPGMPRLEPLVV